MDPQLTLDATSPLPPLVSPHCSPVSGYPWFCPASPLFAPHMGTAAAISAQVCLGAQVQRWRSELGGAPEAPWPFLVPTESWPRGGRFLKGSQLTKGWGRELGSTLGAGVCI